MSLCSIKSDIWELYEEEELDIEVSPVLPPTPNSASSISTTDTVKSRMKAVLIVSPLPLSTHTRRGNFAQKDVMHAVKTRWSRSRPEKRAYTVEVSLRM